MSDDVKRPDVWEEMFPGRFLQAGLLKGKKVTLTITDVVIEKLPDDKKGEKTRGILSFKQTPFQLALNKTNGVCLRAMFGNKPAEWHGKRVVFHQEMDRFGAKKVDSIRIYGSPDISEDMEVEITMPKKAPKIRRLVSTAVGAKQTSVNEVTGEVTTTESTVHGDAYEGPPDAGEAKP